MIRITTNRAVVYVHFVQCLRFAAIRIIRIFGHPMISFEDFSKLDIRIGKILSAEVVPDADKLLVLSIDVGEDAPRTIVSGIREYYPEPEVLIGKKVPVLLNLAPRMIRGVESQGMVLYAVGENALTTLESDAEVGTQVH